MDTSTLKKANAETLAKEFQWLTRVIDTRIKLYFNQPCEYTSVYDVLLPDISQDESNYAAVVKQFNMAFAERVILSLALIPHVAPQLLDIFFIKNVNYDRGFSEFGGIKGQQHGGFLPTGETAAFILAVDSLEIRFNLLDMFNTNHFFRKSGILSLVNSNTLEPELSGLLKLSEEYLSYFTKGQSPKPDYSQHFPATLLKTELNWEDLILESHIEEELAEIQAWINHSETLMNEWGMNKTLKPGFRSLFFGPPGTGKTLAATLLGKSTGLEVYRIDLSMLVSKYIGETEKNLASIFVQAKHKNWILFFDEAEAVLGKQSQIGSLNDKHANYEIAYLLQQIEDFPGLVILASNLKANIDETFARRFQSMIYFPMPALQQRLRLWQSLFERPIHNNKLKLADDVNFKEIAEKYVLTGGAINNVLRYCALEAMRKGSSVIMQNDIIKGISQEFRKEGKIIN